MFEIQTGRAGEIVLVGRLDATHVTKFEEVFRHVSGNRVVDFSELQYIASAGLGVLLATQKRLMSEGHALKLTNLSHHIRDIFRFSGFDNVFEIA